MRRLILLALALTLSACASQDPAVTSGKTLLAAQKTIVNVHEAFRSPCKEGLVPAATCREVDRLVLEAMPIYDAAAQSLLMGIEPDLTNLNALVARLVALQGGVR